MEGKPDTKYIYCILYQTDVLRLLCITLHDNDNTNQHLSLTLLGRLSPRNPAFVS